MPHGFSAFAAIDWSGAAVARPPGLALALAGQGSSPPQLITPPGGWSRGLLLDWLAERAAARERMLIGVDLSAGFPYLDLNAYFPQWAESPPTGPELWALVDRLCANEPHFAANHFIAHQQAARHFRVAGSLGDLHPPGRGRLRITEHGQRAQGLQPYSCFNLVGAAQVGKSSLTGMRVLHRLRGLVPVWPLDPVPEQGPVIVEIYTSLAARAGGVAKGRSKLRDAESLDAALATLGSRPHRPLARYTDHATDALITAAWLRHVAEAPSLWAPTAMTEQIAQTEGWTFGVV